MKSEIPKSFASVVMAGRTIKIRQTSAPAMFLLIQVSPIHNRAIWLSQMPENLSVTPA